MGADKSSMSSSFKASYHIVYYGLRFIALYAFSSFTSLATFKLLHVGPSNDEMFFFTWPWVWIALVLHPFIWNGLCLLVVFALLQLPIIWGLRSGNKWYQNAVIMISLYMQIFIATLLLGTGV